MRLWKMANLRYIYIGKAERAAIVRVCSACRRNTCWRDIDIICWWDVHDCRKLVKVKLVACEKSRRGRMAHAMM